MFKIAEISALLAGSTWVKGYPAGGAGMKTVKDPYQTHRDFDPHKAATTLHLQYLKAKNNKKKLLH